MYVQWLRVIVGVILTSWLNMPYNLLIQQTFHIFSWRFSFISLCILTIPKICMDLLQFISYWNYPSAWSWQSKRSKKSVCIAAISQATLSSSRRKSVCKQTGFDFYYLQNRYNFFSSSVGIFSIKNWGFTITFTIQYSIDSSSHWNSNRNGFAESFQTATHHFYFSI